MMILSLLQMEVEHFSHPDHPLILIDQVLEYVGEPVLCSGCSKPIWGPCYSCNSCFFFLHKKCAELPMEIKRHLHPLHPLILLAKPPPQYTEGSCVCELCKETCEGFVYHCSICPFDLDIKCALPPCFFEVDDSQGQDQFTHIDHPLTLNEEQENRGVGVDCSVCKEPVLSGPRYSCTDIACNFFFHKKCAEIPRKIKQQLHPEHPLLLLKKATPYSHGEWVCYFCNKTCNDCFSYHCFVCDIYLHIQCAFPPCIYEANHQDQWHQFRRLPVKSLFFTCNACGIGVNEHPFMCTTCQIVVHEKCISLRKTINIRQHHHILTHTYFLEEEDESGKPYCGVCQIQFKSDHGGYQCQDCNFSTHVNFALDYIDSSGSLAKHKESMDTSIPTGALEIEHFSHQHSLILVDEFNDNMKCAGCMLPISNPFYGCPQCNFSLHKNCSELPRYLHFEGDLLTLFSKADTTDGIFCCDLCQQNCHGWAYTCEYFAPLDVRCGIKAFSGTITHEGHQHQLFLYSGDEEWSCSACSGVASPYVFRCAICDFNLDFRCATLPREARHEYDEHPLLLTFIDPNDYQFVCQICEKDRDPNLWFYRCEECDFDAHPECALGKHPCIKLGGSYKYDIHPDHPLLLVEKTDLDHHPACHTCGESCDDLALECTDSGCNFIIHWEGKCRYP